ncbi:MAG: CDP-alcohol phosphatidyltransferase family protein [Erysipelotrichaceae bacterium]|nr:CDP-alcohol phosphatidyltransferase family protein [Erysipelotrichaceae bacterium]
MKKNLANIITSIRLIGAICLIFIETLSKPYFIIYSLCGVTDVIDGFVARKLKITSDFGSKLDSISDLLFSGIMLIKVFPFLLARTPSYIPILIYIAVGVRALCYLFVGIRFKKFSSRHTVYNKAISFLMFFLPFMILTDYLTIYCLIILAIAFYSNFEEIHNIKTHISMGSNE